MLSTSSGRPSPNSGTLSFHMEGNCRIRRAAAGYWNVTLATTRRKACWCSQVNIWHDKLWWLIEIFINCVVFWIHHQYDNFKGRTYFRPCNHAWLQKNISGLKLKPCLRLGHGNLWAIKPEISVVKLRLEVSCVSLNSDLYIMPSTL